VTIRRPQRNRSRPDRPAPVATLRFNVSAEGNTSVVHVSGELDCATHNQFVSTATAGHHPSVTIELGGVTFMDCNGYDALVTSRLFVEGEGRSLTITGQTGQPARLIDLITELENGHRQPANRWDPIIAHTDDGDVGRSSSWRTRSKVDVQ
jgi:anti-anti-sigma factor